MQKRRGGFEKVPNQLFQDQRLSLEHIGLLLYLNSHSRIWIVKAKDVQAWFDIGEEKWGALMRDLRVWGYVKTKFARRNGKRAGLHVETFLTPKNSGLEEVSNPANTRPCKSGVIKKTNNERRCPDLEVIDCGDVVESQIKAERQNG